MADADVVMWILDVAARRHRRLPWLRAQVEQGIEEEKTLLGYVQTAPVATATLQRADPAIWGSGALASPAALYLHRLASVMPGRGFGAAMLAAAEEQAMTAGAEFLRLDCSAESEGLRRYYRELGYMELGEVERSTWRLVLFEKRLRGPAQMAAIYRTEMRHLMEAVDRIPTDLLQARIHSNWTVKEVLVHVAGWDRAVAASVDDVLMGRPARLRAMRLEDVNEDLVDSQRGEPLAQVLHDLAEAHHGLLDSLARLSREQWHIAVPGAFWSDGSPMTVASLFAYRYRDQTHYGGHAEEIQAWLDSQSV